MLRLCVFLLLAAIAPIYATSSTIYMPFPNGIIVPTNTSSVVTGRLISVSQCCSTVLSADGQTFYLAGSEVAEVDRVSGKNLRTYKTQNPIWAPAPIEVAPDKSKIYVGTCSLSEDGVTCQAGNVEIIDTASGENLAVIPMGPDQVFEIHAAPDGKTLYAVHFVNGPQGCCADATQLSVSANVSVPPSNALTAIHVSSLQIGRSYVEPFPLFGIAITTMVISPDSLTAFVLGYVFPNQTVQEVNLASMTLKATLIPPPTVFQEQNGSLALSQDGSSLAALLPDGELFIFDTATRAVTYSFQGLSGYIIGFSLDRSLLYLQNGQDIDTMTVSTGSISVIRTFENMIGILLSPDRSTMYRILGSDSAIEAVKEGAATPSKVYNVGGSPTWLALSPDGIVYTAGFNGGVWATSTVSGRSTVELGGQSGIDAIGVSTDGSTLYVLIGYILGEVSEPQIIFVNASTGAVENTVAMPACTDPGSYPLGTIAVSPNGRSVYATYCGPVAIFDTATQSLAATITGTSIGTLALSPKGNLLFASSGISGSNSVSVFNTATLKLIGTIPLTTSTMAFSPDGTRVYIATPEMNSTDIAVVNTSTLAVTESIPGIFPAYSAESMAVTPDGALLYVGGPNGGVIDAKTLQVFGGLKPGYPIAIH